MVIFKGRAGCWIVIIVVALLVLIAFLLSRCLPDQSLLGAPTGVPVDLTKMIPTSWKVQQSKACDFDNDGETEWLVIYSYDAVTEPAYSLIGGVIYDAQVNRVPQAPSTQSPYRPALLIPYKLLPDIYSEKGQGYLGETKVTVTLYPPASGNDCRAHEIIVQGFSGGDFPTRLSIFRWEGEAVGYWGEHFVGNARVVFQGSGPITEVTTFNRLNDRSAVCDVQFYSRPPGTVQEPLPPRLKFAANDAAQTIDFCFGAPNDPTYPEGVVVALLRGHNPEDKEGSPSPTGDTYLMKNAVLPPALAGLKEAGRAAYRIRAFTTQGTLGSQPAQGYLCDPAQVAQGSGVWLCGAETAEVTTEIVLPGASGDQTIPVRWQLVSIASDALNADVRWRVTAAEPGR